MDKISSLIKELTLEEKVSILSGSDSWHTTSVERLNIPRVKMTDGPNGARGDAVSGETAACYPNGSAVASTWNTKLIEKLGKSLGVEAKTKDADMLLGPTINIHRHPTGGRHFECYSEDPILTGKATVAYVKGVQSEKVSACLKHFVGNDTEFERHRVSSNIDERTLREIYLLPFEMGVKQGGALGVMSAYNQLNNIYCSSHKEILIDILKEEWNFPGYVVSDWGASLQTVENAIGGLDCEMPGPAKSWGENLVHAVKKGNVPEDIIDDKVRRILTVAEFTGRLESMEEKPETSSNLESDKILIRQAANEGMVLLKNKNTLPLDETKLSKVAVIGPNALRGQFIGGGSANVKPHYVVHPLEGLTNNLDSLEVNYAKGCHTHKYLPAIEKNLISCPETGSQGFKVDFFEGEDLSGSPIETKILTGQRFWAMQGFGVDVATKSEPPSLSVRFSANLVPDITGEHHFELVSIGSARLKIDGEEIVDNWTSQEPGEAFFSYGSAPRRSSITLEEGHSYLLEIEYKWMGRFPAVQIGMLPPDKEDLMAEAIRLAEDSDAVILLAGTNSDWETEGNDRSTLELPGKQNELIEKVIEVNQNTVIVMNTGGPCTMPWIDKAPAVLQSWFPGQEFGNSLYDLIFGKVNPSGKLTTTFPKRLEDTPAFNHYPGEKLQMDYLEGLYVGYRWYEKKNIEPLFYFGHGLSYTNFEYANLKVIPPQTEDAVISLSLNIKNIGERAGKEVVQLYVSVENSNVDRPLKELKSFTKIDLESSESQTVTFNLTERDLAYWDVDKKTWALEPAEYKVLVGSSSKDIKLESSVWLG